MVKSKTAFWLWDNLCDEAIALAGSVAAGGPKNLQNQLPAISFLLVSFFLFRSNHNTVSILYT